MSNTESNLRYSLVTSFERRANCLVPVRRYSALQPDGTLKCLRVTELTFPLASGETSEAEWEDAGYIAIDRDKRWELMNTLDPNGLPLLQCASEYPRQEPYLELDVAADEALFYHLNDYGTENPWVPELFDTDLVEESDADMD